MRTVLQNLSPEHGGSGQHSLARPFIVFYLKPDVSVLDYFTRGVNCRDRWSAGIYRVPGCSGGVSTVHGGGSKYLSFGGCQGFWHWTHCRLLLEYSSHLGRVGHGNWRRGFPSVLKEESA